MSPELPHEKLDVFRVSVQLVTFVAEMPPSRGSADLMDQLRRASSSISLNVAEGVAKHGRDRARYYEIARGSALECAAAFRVLLAQRIVSPSIHNEGRMLCERLYAMLTRMIH